jgi:hypothetical protein
MPARVNCGRVRVEFGDCDPAQIAYYPNLVAWVDHSTHYLFEAIGFPLRETQARRGIQVPIVGLNVRFLSPATWATKSISTVKSLIGDRSLWAFIIASRTSEPATPWPRRPRRESASRSNPANRRIFSVKSFLSIFGRPSIKAPWCCRRRSPQCCRDLLITRIGVRNWPVFAATTVCRRVCY